MDRDFMGNVIKDINKPKTKYDIEKQYWIEYSKELQSRINKAIEYMEKMKKENDKMINFEIQHDEYEHEGAEYQNELIDELLDILYSKRK